jgi:hypothetical protein
MLLDLERNQGGSMWMLGRPKALLSRLVFSLAWTLGKEEVRKDKLEEMEAVVSLLMQFFLLAGTWEKRK